MAVPTLVQSAANTVTASATNSVTLNGVAAGNLLLVGISCTVNFSDTFTVSDGVNSYSLAVTKLGSIFGRSQINYAMSVAAGNTTITVTSSGSASYTIVACEVAGCAQASTLDATDTNDEGLTTGTQHFCAVAGINTAPGGSFVLAVGTLSGIGGTITNGVNYTNIPDSSTQSIFEYTTTATTFSLTRGDFTSANATANTGVIASFKAAAPIWGWGSGAGLDQAEFVPMLATRVFSI